jgi:hypothetical protein
MTSNLLNRILILKLRWVILTVLLSEWLKRLEL